MKQLHIWSVITTCFISLSLLGVEKSLPVPDGKEADMSKPVQVYILMGQSNMLGAGNVAGAKEGTLENAVKVKNKYPYLVDSKGNWSERRDVRNVRVMVDKGGMKLFNNEAVR
jgi:hypothetical protein